MPEFDSFAKGLRDSLPPALSTLIIRSPIQSLRDGPPAPELARWLVDSSTKDELTKLAPGRTEELRSALWLAAGDIERSHAISQGIDNAEGSFLHGIMHRREGDFGNAKYWFRQAAHHPILPRIAEQTNHVYDDPFGFVDACQRAIMPAKGPAGSGIDDSYSSLQRAQWIELQTMIDWLLNESNPAKQFP